LVGDVVVFAIVDAGPGGGVGARPPGHGLGIASARERLALAFGERSRLALETTAAGGTRVRLVVPRAGAAA
jgi:sensor histidine kinase YesM